MVLKSYEIIIRTYYGKKFGSKSTFFTTGSNIKKALPNFIERSNNFDIITKGEKKVQIIIKEID